MASSEAVSVGNAVSKLYYLQFVATHIYLQLAHSQTSIFNKYSFTWSHRLIQIKNVDSSVNALFCRSVSQLISVIPNYGFLEV